MHILDHNFITCSIPKNQTNYSTLFLKLIYLEELDTLFAITYDGSEVINIVSRK